MRGVLSWQLEKWRGMVRGWIYLKLEPIGFAGGLEVGTEKQRGARGDARILA